MKTNSNSTIGGGGFHHVAVSVPDFDASYRFYIEGLGFKERLSWESPERRAVMLDTGDGNYLEIFSGGKRHDDLGVIIHFALRTNDCDAASQRALDAGATLKTAPKDVTIDATQGPTPVRISFVISPSGEEIEFLQSELT